MWRRVSSIVAVLALVVAGRATPAPSAPVRERPRLVLLIAVDQFRYDYLIRYGQGFTGGLRRLLDEGASFTNARLEHYPSVTAPGHATMLTGAPPSLSGIVGNDWYDRTTKKTVTSVEDAAVVGLAGAAASPHRLLVSTLGDELKMAGLGSRVVGLSLKDRSAILPVGRMADAALWFNTKTGGSAAAPGISRSCRRG